MFAHGNINDVIDMSLLWPAASSLGLSLFFNFLMLQHWPNLHPLRQYLYNILLFLANE